MLLKFNNLTIRNATVNDANLLAKWWNDGKIMAHAGFPLGTGETPEKIAEKISKDSDEKCRRLIIEFDNNPIGEMSYYNVGDDTAEIGIKICDFSKQNQGYGKILLSMLISSLYNDLGYKVIDISTNVKNTRAQHVYEELGASKVQVIVDAWRDQLGVLQSIVEYKMYPESFVNFAE